MQGPVNLELAPRFCNTPAAPAGAPTSRYDGKSLRSALRYPKAQTGPEKPYNGREIAMKLKDGLIGAVVVTIVAVVAWVWMSPAGVERAPRDLALTTASGEPLNLGDLRQRPVLVTFWATTCTTCVKEIPELKALYRELAPRGLEVIGITMYYDPPNQVLKMIQQRDIPYPVAFDLDQQAMQAFGMKQAITPTTFLVAPDGRIVMRKAGLLDMDQLKRTIEGMLPAA